MAGHLGSMMIYDFAPMRVRVSARHWSETDIEAGLFRTLGTIPGRLLERQVACCGNIPDLVSLSGDTYIIVEVKRDVIGWRALAQITRYVDHWIDELADVRKSYTVMGILAAPSIRRSVRAELSTIPWCSFLPIELVGRAA